MNAAPPTYEPVSVFCGPTVSAARVREALPGANALPPAQLGDVLRAARAPARPSVIALVDGFFETVPAVWHRELLAAMAAGIHVYGSASMGALRAAELHPYGMRGAGTIFADYRDGALVRDDEVVVVHAPARSGYRKLTEATVNIRATVSAAVAARTMTPAAAQQAVAAASSLFYYDRTWDALLDGAADWQQQLRRHLDEHGPVDQKLIDAETLLGEIAADRDRWADDFACPVRLEATQASLLLEQTESHPPDDD